MMKTKKDFSPDKHLAAVCGLFCPACIIFMAAQGNEGAIGKAVDIFNIAPEDLKCDGCRTSERFAYCETCRMWDCATEQGFEFCGQCEEYPCEELKIFQARYPHRIELWHNQARIGAAGYEQWFIEMLEHYACPDCETINSAYHLTCQSCERYPGSEHANLHQNEIEAFLSGTI